jgi:hypothetical protein
MNMIKNLVYQKMKEINSENEKEKEIEIEENKSKLLAK